MNLSSCGKITWMFVLAMLMASEMNAQWAKKVNMKPCLGSLYSDQLTVKCIDKTPKQNIKAFLKASRVVDGIHEAVIFNKEMKELPTNLFEKVKVEKLNLNINSLLELTPEAFEGIQRSLKSLDVTGGQMTKFPFAALEYLTNVDTVRFTELAHLKRIETPSNQKNQTSITDLYIIKGHLQHIGEGAFKMFSKLRFLQLHGNDLTYLPANSFNGKMTSYLSLSNNPIRIFPEELVLALEIPYTTLDLGHTELSNFAESNWKKWADHAKANHISVLADGVNITCDKKLCKNQQYIQDMFGMSEPICNELSVWELRSNPTKWFLKQDCSTSK